MFCFIFFDYIDSNSCQEKPGVELYDMVLYADGHRVYADMTALRQYVNMVTILVQQYLLAHKTLRPLFVPAMCDNNKNKKTSDNLSMENPGVMYQESSLRNHGCHGDSKNDKRTDEWNDKVYDKQSSPTRGTSSMEVTGTEQPKSSSGKNMSDFLSRIVVDKQVKSIVRKDANILKDFKVYLDLYQCHLLTLCKPEDSEKVKEALQELALLSLLVSE